MAPNLIELPKRPSIIVSPSKGNKGCIFNFSLKYSPNSTSVEPSLGVLFTPPSTILYLSRRSSTSSPPVYGWSGKALWWGWFHILTLGK